MHASVLKVVCAVAVFMNVHSEKAGSIGSTVWKIRELYFNHKPGIPSGTVKVSNAHDIRIDLAAGDGSKSVRCILEDGHRENRLVFHGKRLPHFLISSFSL